MQYNNETRATISPNDRKLPKAQQVILAVILFGYPLISWLLNYINPPSETVIQSRISQVYIPAILIQTLVFLVIIWATTKTADGQINLSNIAGIGIKPKDFNLLNLAIGIMFLFTALIILNIISNIIDYYGIFRAEDITYLLPRSPEEKVFWIMLSLIAGVTEELCFRGFVITRLAILTGSVWPGAILGAVSFGLGHLYQGWAGVAIIGIYGLLFSLLFIARGSLV
ncbi:MAG: hypothetical protein B6D58_05920, partial [candidate division Zixibacteria bacterium 4484_95]